MSLPYFVKHIEDDERIQGVIYKSAWMYAPSLVLATILIWLALFYFFYLESLYSTNGIVISVLAQIVGIFILARRVMILKYTAWLLTDKRLLDFSQKSFLRAEINEEYLSDLYRPSLAITKLWEKLCGCATIRVMFIHERAVLELSGVAQAKTVVDFLKNLLPDHQDEKEQLKNLQKNLGEDEFEALLTEMSKEE